MPQDYIINCQWKLNSENINQFRKRLETYLFGESYDMNQKTINEQYPTKCKLNKIKYN